VDELRKGYGFACLKGIDYLKNKPILGSDIVVFIDADHTYESVTEDNTTWLPKIKKDGVIFTGHFLSKPEKR